MRKVNHTTWEGGVETSTAQLKVWGSPSRQVWQGDLEGIITLELL